MPRYAPLTLADRAVGLHAAIALVSAVLHARASGRGQQVEIPMFEGMAHMTLGDHLGGATFDPPLAPPATPGCAPHRRPYATADGYLCLLIYNDKHWRNFFGSASRNWPTIRAFAAMARAPRTSARSTPSSPMSSATAPRTTGWPIWRAPTSRRPACTPSKTCWMTNTWPPPVSSARRTTPPKAAAHARAAGLLRRTPTAIRRPAPALGQHSRELLAEAGYDEAAIDALFARGVALSPDSRNPRNARWTLNSRPTSRRCARRLASVNAIPTNTGWSATAKAAFPSRCTPTGPRRLAGIAMPQEYGGAGLGMTEAALMMQTIAASGAGFAGASAVHMNIFGLNPVVFGDDAQRRRWLPP